MPHSDGNNADSQKIAGTAKDRRPAAESGARLHWPIVQALLSGHTPSNFKTPPRPFPSSPGAYLFFIVRAAGADQIAPGLPPRQ